ncbi:MAG: hypothetical protein HQK51_09780 [Oligoflexia bacterium]|nr:hypothetical protein [Oligoflexia bacterium]
MHTSLNDNDNNNILRFHPKEVINYLSTLKLNIYDFFIDFAFNKNNYLSYASSKVNFAIGIYDSQDESEKQFSDFFEYRNGLLIQSKLQNFNKNILISSLENSVYSKYFKNLSTIAFNKCSAKKSLHNLTDEQKQTFLTAIYPLLAHNALFVIEDYIFDFDKEHLDENMNFIINDAKKYYGEEKFNIIKKEFLSLLKDKFPTSINKWISIFNNSGYEIIFHKQYTCFYGKILVKKTKSNLKTYLS